MQNNSRSKENKRIYLELMITSKQLQEYIPMNQMTQQQKSEGIYSLKLLYIIKLAIYSWTLKFPTIYHITAKAKPGLTPDEVLVKIKSEEIEFEAESYDGFTPGDFIKTCYSDENKELIMKMEEEEEQ
jgi:hypothetical protein